MKRSFFHKAIIWLGMAILLAVTALIAARWRALPQSIATHFGAGGQIDAYGDKSTLIALLVIAWLLYVMVSFAGFFVEALMRGEKAPPRATASLVVMIDVMGLLLAAVFAYLVVCSALCRNLGRWFDPVFIACMCATALIGITALLVNIVKKQ